MTLVKSQTWDHPSMNQSTKLPTATLKNEQVITPMVPNLRMRPKSVSQGSVVGSQQGFIENLIIKK